LRAQKGQAIVLVGLLLVVLFGFVGLAIDGGRGYLERRQLQAAVDAASLAAAYDFMVNNSLSNADYAGLNLFARNERLDTLPTCSPSGATLTCPFADPAGTVLTITSTDYSIAGVTFTATATRQVGTTVMQVLGVGPTVGIGATATALARRPGTNGAAVQTLSPSCTNSLTFSGSGTANLVGDVWSNGNVSGGGSSTGSVTGNVVGVCSNPAPPFLPNPWSVSGAQVNGWNMPDPGYAMPTLNASNPNWNSPSCDGECPGTYLADPHLTGGAGCYFLEAGVYNFSQGFTQQGGLVSNELRPPDEPNVYANATPTTATLTAGLTGGSKPTTMSVTALPGALPNGSSLTVGGEDFTLTTPAAAGTTTLNIVKQTVAADIPSGSFVSFRALPQFWDAVSPCSGAFSLSATGNTNNLSGTWSVEVTSVRWEPYTCKGQAAPSGSCYIRESAPSMCKTITLGSSTNIKVQVTAAVPGAEYLNVYLAENDSCSGLSYLTQFPNTVSSQVVINNSSFPAGWPAGAATPPDHENMPIASGLPNSDPPAGTPPRGDLANEYQCVNPSTGANTVCGSGTVNPGAVIFYIPSTGCVSMNGGGDIYIFSGYQYGRIIMYEPGPEQSSFPNTCSNTVNGHDFTSFIGIFYIPAADIKLNGTSRVRATIAGGLIAWTATVLGSENLAITADPSLRAWPSTVRLTQ
jgi:Flp pilus assembly protein TadG